jgi:ferredoxin
MDFYERNSVVMAQIEEKWEDNVEGAFYIDKSCSMCNLCTDVAPDNIKESADGDHCIIFKQPENDDEMTNMQDAVEQCPCEAIGKIE